MICCQKGFPFWQFFMQAVPDSIIGQVLGGGFMAPRFSREW